MLEIDYALLDKIAIWFIADKQVLANYRTGDLLPFGKRPVNHEKFVFDLPDNVGEIEIYIQAQTAGSLRLPMRLWDKQSFAEYSAQQNLVMGLFFGFLMAMMLSNLFLFVNSGSFTYISYSGYVICLTLTLATLFGVGYKYLWPESVWLQARGLGLFSSLTMMFSLLFSIKLMEIKRHNQPLYRVLKASAIGFAVPGSGKPCYACSYSCQGRATTFGTGIDYQTFNRDLFVEKRRNAGALLHRGIIHAAFLCIYCRS